MLLDQKQQRETADLGGSKSPLRFAPQVCSCGLVNTFFLSFLPLSFWLLPF